jgi:hypothetical protein
MPRFWRDRDGRPLGNASSISAGITDLGYNGSDVSRYGTFKIGTISVWIGWPVTSTSFSPT